MRPGLGKEEQQIRVQKEGLPQTTEHQRARLVPAHCWGTNGLSSAGTGVPLAPLVGFAVPQTQEEKSLAQVTYFWLGRS